jgi:hypothetical protein
MRVYELAKELGLEPAVVMSRLDYLGESVRSVSSRSFPPTSPSLAGTHISDASDGAVRSRNRLVR